MKPKARPGSLRAVWEVDVARGVGASMRRASIVCLIVASIATSAESAAFDRDVRGHPPQLAEHDEPAAPHDIDLFPRVPIGRAAGWILDPEPSPDDREEIAEAELERYFDEVLERDQLEVGRVDGWYYEMGRLMRARFLPDESAVASERRAGMSPVSVIWDELRRYASGPQPPAAVSNQLPPEVRFGTDRDPVQRQIYEQMEMCTVQTAPVTWYGVVVRITHNPEGEVSAVWVERSSGSRSLDDSALRAVREGAATLSAPPAPIVGERQAIQSDWAFEIGDVAMPIYCGLVCTDDPILGGMCSAGGRGITRTRLSLLRVHDEQHPSPAELRAARRGDRERPRP